MPAATLTRIDTIRRRLRQSGAKPCHEERILQAWARALPVGTRRRPAADFLPGPVRALLPDLHAELDGLVRLHSAHPAEDGSERLVIELADGETIETVLLPRGGLCVSTQVGCAVGCQFCMTGHTGLRRHLGSAEIVAQVALARRLRPVVRVVFMGMGEPSHNLDNVLAAIELLGAGGAIGHKELVFSTVGDRRVFARLPRAPVRPALALSLHSTDAALRARLLPRAPRLDPAELIALADDYGRATGHPILYQWTLLAGVNDTPAEEDGLVRLLTGRRGMLNLIPYNTNDGLPFRRPDPAHAAAFAERLLRRGINTWLRRSVGQEVEGGCGQLRARTIPLT